MTREEQWFVLLKENGLIEGYANWIEWAGERSHQELYEEVKQAVGELRAERDAFESEVLDLHRELQAG